MITVTITITGNRRDIGRKEWRRMQREEKIRDRQRQPIAEDLARTVTVGNEHPDPKAREKNPYQPTQNPNRKGGFEEAGIF